MLKLLKLFKCFSEAPWPKKYIVHKHMRNKQWQKTIFHIKLVLHIYATKKIIFLKLRTDGFFKKNLYERKYSKSAELVISTIACTTIIKYQFLVCNNSYFKKKRILISFNMNWTRTNEQLKSRKKLVQLSKSFLYFTRPNTK